jgi:hypothetical protein
LILSRTTSIPNPTLAHFIKVYYLWTLLTQQQSFKEITGTPAGTAVSTDNDSPSALYNDSGLTVAEVLDTHNFYPFQNELQYSLSLWFLDSQLSAAAIDSYIRNEAINPHRRPFKDCQQWLSILELIPYGIHNDTWQRVSIQFPDELDNGTGRYIIGMLLK